VQFNSFKAPFHCFGLGPNSPRYRDCDGALWECDTISDTTSKCDLTELL